ncbi:hypothetical protein C8A00DRAFT_15107 [Chaetomidium leptoderma]|uniref:BTB domain-containing protein n=1 Tax=Chaetomidium leptoderma TaxID=669021 RepID=A0AAN6VLU6_9PEZI|nr:hypothetical protein C8A00DRAFT_15107 [Chaetomidium leptoderma]
MCDYTMDPSGDVVLTLKTPNAPLAIWDAGDTEPTASTTPSDGPVTFLVSSRHLILASPVLKAMLTGGWDEGAANNGQRQIRAEDWDAEALEIVMNVLHNHYRSVPKMVTLKLLAKIALIVDYYEVHEALQMMASMWIHALRKSLPNSFGTGVVLWTLVSWVFGDAAVFKRITKVAILRSRKDVEIPQELPIPLAVIDRINQHRKDSMGVISAGLHRLRQDYTEGREGCSPECSAMHLGALIKHLHTHKFLDHPLETPFGDSSLVEVVECLSGLKSPTFYVVATGDGSRFSSARCIHRVHQCPRRTQVGVEAFNLGVGENCSRDEHSIASISTLKDFAALLVHGVKDKLEGLRLADFQLVSDTQEQ